MLPENVSERIFLSFENPRFPPLITAQTARHLLDDLIAGGSGYTTLTEGKGVYKNIAENCLQVDISSKYDMTTASAVYFTVTYLARWAGQESVLLLRNQRPLECLPVGVALALVDHPDACIGQIVNAQTGDQIGDTMLWREAKRAEIFIDGVPKDHTFISGKYFTLSAE